MSDTTSAPAVLLTVRQFCERHSWARPGGLRHMIFHARTTGFGVCVRRFGRKVLLDEAAVYEWLRERGDSPSTATRT